MKKNNSKSFEIAALKPEYFDAALLLLEGVFYAEQHIPKALIPLQNAHQKWWCIINNKQLVGIVAAWKTASEWHWGRLAIQKEFRGFGLGKKIAIQSFHELFRMGIEEVIIDARDITAEMVLKLGGKITGEKTEFYGSSITPMKLHKKDFTP